MRLQIYMSEADGFLSGPSLFIPVDVATLPAHPNGKRWRFVRVIEDADPLFADRLAVGRLALELHGYFLTHQA